jgi:hypothetical protein
MKTIEKTLKYDANHIIGINGLKRHVTSEIITKWTTTQSILTPNTIQELEERRQELAYFGNYWDYQAIKMNFLTTVFKCVGFREAEIMDVFHQRPLSGIGSGQLETVICDCFLSKPFGVFGPQTPYYFFLQQFKQKQNEDAEGQMLLAMLISQHKNANGKPIYGCYIQGKFWVFTTLHDKNYCVSRSYDATQQADLYQIIFILRQLKHIILTELSV